MKPWTRTEDEFLRNHADWEDRAIAQALGRSTSAVKNRRYHHSIPKIHKDTSKSLCWHCANAYADRCDWIGMEKQVWEQARKRQRLGYVTFEVLQCKYYRKEGERCQRTGGIARNAAGLT